jgi:hypothetical protein
MHARHPTSLAHRSFCQHRSFVAFVAPLTALLAAVAEANPAVAQEPKAIAYPDRDMLSPFRNPTDAYAPPDELFAALRTMRALAADGRLPKSFDDKGREVVDDERWREALRTVRRLGIDAGYLAQIVRVNRNANDRAVAFYAMFWVENPDHTINLIEHIPGEPVHSIREVSLPRAVEFLKRHLGRRFGDLAKEEQDAVRKATPEPGSPVARSRGITRLPEAEDRLHTLSLVPFLQLLDVDTAIDRAQALWFLAEVGGLRPDLLEQWLEPSLPRIRQLLADDDERVRAQAIELTRTIGPRDLPAPPTEPKQLQEWAERAAKHMFPPIRNLNDTLIELLPSAERDALATAGEQALANGSIGDPINRRLEDGTWLRGCRIVSVPEALRPLAIPAGAVITKVNGAEVADAKSLLKVVREALEQQRHPRQLLVEYSHKDKAHAVEYRIL